METHEEFKEVVKEDASADVEPHIKAILNAYQQLVESVAIFKDELQDEIASAAAQEGGSFVYATTVATSSVSPDAFRHALYMAMLAKNRTALNAVEKLKAEYEADERKGIDALKDFFALVSPSDFRLYINASLATGLSLIGIAPTDIYTLIGWGFLHLMPDDARLYNAVKAAARKLRAMEKSEEESPPTGYSLMEIAKARVAFEQLRSHIEDNWIHYMQTMWLREHADQRFLRLQGYGSIAGVLDNDILGFLGHKAAFPLNDTTALKAQIDFEQMMNSVVLPASEPQLITLPTSGTILEAIVGECDACETFIRQSRNFDLRTQEAKTLQEEAETKRRQMRLESTPPDLVHPGQPLSGKVVIHVDGESGNE